MLLFIIIRIIIIIVIIIIVIIVFPYAPLSTSPVHASLSFPFTNWPPPFTRNSISRMTKQTVNRVRPRFRAAPQADDQSEATATFVRGSINRDRSAETPRPAANDRIFSFEVRER